MNDESEWKGFCVCNGGEFFHLVLSRNLSDSCLVCFMENTRKQQKVRLRIDECQIGVGDESRSITTKLGQSFYCIV